MWPQIEGDYGFRPDDEMDVRAEISSMSAVVSSRFHCPGRSSCIAYILRKRNRPCGGTSGECVQLAKSSNGSYFQDKVILSTVGRIAHSVSTVIEPIDDGREAVLHPEDFSMEE